MQQVKLQSAGLDERWKLSSIWSDWMDKGEEIREGGEEENMDDDMIVDPDAV